MSEVPLINPVGMLETDFNIGVKDFDKDGFVTDYQSMYIDSCKESIRSFLFLLIK